MGMVCNACNWMTGNIEIHLLDSQKSFHLDEIISNYQPDHGI